MSKIQDQLALATARAIQLSRTIIKLDSALRKANARIRVLEIQLDQAIVATDDEWFGEGDDEQAEW